MIGRFWNFSWETPNCKHWMSLWIALKDHFWKLSTGVPWYLQGIGSKLIPKSKDAQISYIRQCSICMWPTHVLSGMLSSLDYLQHVLQWKCYGNSCWYVTNSGFASWNFLEFFSWICLIQDWMNLWMQKSWVKRADWRYTIGCGVFFKK